ncbi:FKBP-type peptidyl-prolyl cis-trans isomerase [Algibacter sp. R77976]|uniref:FKBP-type peptidyl-prolyl cis-trans isomerase n=1 Tax=Algibacter sp. R77976 TaxID=3093873 RepID=UPI0037C7D50F
MSLRKIGFFILSFVLVFSSCKKDDDGDTEIIVVEINDRTEQQAIDDALLIDYLETHYYNSDVFIDNADPSISELIISELADGEVLQDGFTLLKDDVETHYITYEDTDYVYYILRINQGGGLESPAFTDTVRVNYEGFTLDGNVFDSRFTQDIDLVSTIDGVYGWVKVFPQFNTSTSFDENDDGTINYFNHGAGVMFLPSGLAYFSIAQTDITSYSPLIFKFDLLQSFENDHDNDGVPSYLEDLNNDDNLIVNYDDLTDETDDDTDGDGFANFNDADDDGDGVLTINEDINNDGDPTNDIGANGIPNYLDPEETASNED